MNMNTKVKTMSGRRIQAAAFLGCVLLLATTLAGCTSTSPSTAAALQGEADDRAQEWDSGAQLVLIVGTEGTFQMQGMMDQFEPFDSPELEEAARQDFWERVEDDPEPGDGKAEFWLYVYRGGDGEHLIVVVDRDEKIIYEDQAQEAEDLGSPVGEYSVDSDDAMRIALEANDELAGAAETEHFAFVAGLFRESAGTDPNWIVAGGGGSSEGGGGGMVRIDATTGDVLETQGGGGAPSNWT